MNVNGLMSVSLEQQTVCLDRNIKTNSMFKKNAYRFVVLFTIFNTGYILHSIRLFWNFNWALNELKNKSSDHLNGYVSTEPKNRKKTELPYKHALLIPLDNESVFSLPLLLGGVKDGDKRKVSICKKVDQRINSVVKVLKVNPLIPYIHVSFIPSKEIRHHKKHKNLGRNLKILASLPCDHWCSI